MEQHHKGCVHVGESKKTANLASRSCWMLVIGESESEIVFMVVVFVVVVGMQIEKYSPNVDNFQAPVFWLKFSPQCTICCGAGNILRLLESRIANCGSRISATGHERGNQCCTVGREPKTENENENGKWKNKSNKRSTPKKEKSHAFAGKRNQFHLPAKSDAFALSS